MRLVLNASLAIAGWTGLVLLSHGSQPLPTIASVLALALLVGGLLALVVAVIGHGVLRLRRHDRGRRWLFRG
jgi:Alphavirus glycoprotein J